MASLFEAMTRIVAEGREPEMKATEHVFEHSETRGRARLIVLLLALAADAGVSGVSLAELIRGTRLSEPCVRKHLDALVAGGDVRVTGDEYALAWRSVR